MIADAVAQAKARALDEHERILRDQLKDALPPPPDLDLETRQRLAPFLEWCAKANVRHAPAKPFVVAAWVFQLAGSKVSQREILDQTAAIGRLHDFFSLSNPVATQAVRFAIASVTRIEAPRSWTGAEKLEFASLPEEIQAALARREADRDKALRQAQNEAADLRKQVTATAKPAETEKEKDDMAKKEGWQRGEGAYSQSGDVKLKQVPEPPFTKGRDISRTVDANNDRSEGFSAKLDNRE